MSSDRAMATAEIPQRAKDMMDCSMTSMDRCRKDLLDALPSCIA